MRRLRLLVLLTLVTGLSAAREMPAPVLTVVTWGGAYEASQRAAYFEPFTEQTGIEVETVRFNGGLKELRAHLQSGQVEWDVIDLIRANAQAACDEGLLEPLDSRILLPAPDGTPAEEDFIDGAIGRCDVTQLVFATVIAFDDRAFPGEKPERVEDFFNLERFPGKRALRKAPVGLFEWALLSYGVPVEQLYALLSTQRGMELAFRRLNKLRDHLIWWQGGEESADLLAAGEVAMATGYNGRFFHAQVVEGAPISVIWDGQLLDYNSWAIPRGTNQKALAERFIRFATSTEAMAAQANRISYGPTRASAQRRIGLHVETGVPMRAYLPNRPAHLSRAIRRDHHWYANTGKLRESLFQQWLRDPPLEEAAAANRAAHPRADRPESASKDRQDAEKRPTSRPPMPTDPDAS